MAGTLFVVATPIGNLEDLTFRALRTLKEVDLIAAEDTRRTAKLLAHYGVSKPMVSLREHNERRESSRLVARLASGESIALVSDAGTPGISDPGAELVAAARHAGIKVVPIPGASAVTAALSAAGVAASEFVFLGFPPHGSGQRAEWFGNLEEEMRTVVFFEAPHRIAETIGRLAKLSPSRQAFVFSELTKLHEREVVSESSWLSGGVVNAQGEFVIVLGPASMQIGSADVKARAALLVGDLTKGKPLEFAMAVKVAAHLLGTRESMVTNAVRKQSISAKRQNDGAP